MKKVSASCPIIRRRDLVLGGVGLACAAAASQLAAADRLTGSIDTRLRAALEPAIVAGYPGISAAIGNEHGILWSGAAGLADVERRQPMSTSLSLGIGSITKIFVATVIVQLIEAGKLKLGDTPLQLLGSELMAGIGNADTATVEQLLSHTSGVRSWEDESDWIRHGRGALLDSEHIWGKTEALAYIRGKPALFAPGTRYSYSNSNFTILGLVIGHLTGNNAEEELRRRILAPLDLDGMALEGFETIKAERLPKRYHFATPSFVRDAGIASEFHEVRRGLIDVSASNLSVEWTAGGYVARAADLIKFMTALRTGKLLSPASLRFMLQWRSIGGDESIGHNLFRVNSRAGPVIGHNGAVLGFTAFTGWFEASGLTVAMLTNVGVMHSGPITPEIDDVALRSPFTDIMVRLAHA